ncbi:RNA polymerase sigma-70 factor [Mucilaginibacter sp. cycad4]|uniref:RNA polymerase sigma factor n=1 Tax=Mucilaginibacter sp. cycad4 TaxID=3342096 RepID=UPI002AAB3CCA|nr:RNA polymerase sigma-70 factor [Mucilaginibacter gossypii]WPV02090.1 RNA polymerase sigma-70 factor [Mucilaginibacter gossypii]
MLSEVELIALIKAGDINAFDEFYKRNWRALYQTAYRSTGSSDDAKDLVQTVFINLWNCRYSLQPDRYNASYLFRSLKNSIINFHKKDSVRKKSMDNLLYVEYGDQYTHEDNLIAKELSVVIEGEIRELPKKMQEVFILSRQQNLSVNEISEALNIAPRTVKNQLSNALKILRTKLGIF